MEITLENQARELLHEHSLKVTKPRLRILTYLMSHHNHPTVETIYQAQNAAGLINKATIYNTLNTLVKVGIIMEIKNGDNSTHYDFFVKPHFHIICKNYGKIADVFYPNFDKIEDQMRENAEKQTGFTTTASHLEIFGLCPECQKKLKK
ncbi:Fur family transcriptional regulator [Lactobacillus intestinalis]|uniref:Ferric uptake regulator n=1 Tax=Lactobacillus intestinalis DSM 6629 TaxID=1423761 RepID=A0ABR5PQW7_9LACO|nr:Fur family transcriptional regulator [Lactobacillus intestinalis]KRM32335.1 ferric uptake regulator [Lactobacillus intestinalis DSM 6629]UTW39885.1 transcriptional repressor [Lactobacillus intestinalis]